MNIFDLLEKTIQKQASDLHITVGRPPVMRLSGELRPVEDRDLEPEDTEKLVNSILTDAQQKKFVANRSVDIAYSLNSNGSVDNRFRVNAFYQRGHVAAVFRRLSDRIYTIRELGLPENISRFASLHDGLVLVTGPTGSGKSTTLAAILDLINETRSCHIITIEDPIEYVHTHKKSLVNQREVHSDVHDFPDALRYALREDPDVILVGEMRDLETIRTAIMAAETGHLVFSTLHSRDAVSTINRIIGVFPEKEQQLIRQQLSLTIKAVMSQKLMKCLGNQNMVPAVEIMIATPAISNLIRSGKEEQIYSSIETGSLLGMQTMEDALCKLCRDGRICEDTARSCAKSPKLVDQKLRRRGMRS